MRLAALAAALLVVPAASAAGWRVVGQHSESGSFAVVASSASVTAPHAMRFTVSSTPSGSTSGHWYLKCNGRVKQADFSATTPVAKTLPVPAAAKSCVAVVNATLASGKMTVTIYAR